jgi:glycogen operon protein
MRPVSRSYANKHNTMNGADNRDGMDENCSANYGFEGESGDIQTQQLRRRQIRNLLATLALSRGVPMPLGGDEFGRTQLGNNNPYCQDNRVSWYDWRLVERYAELVRFTRELMNWRKRHSVFRAGEFYTEDQLHWFAPEGGQPDWQGATFAIDCLIPRAGNGVDADADGESSHALCLLFNAAQVATVFQLPERDSHRWRLVMDTGQSAPDHLQTTALQSHEGASYKVDADALAVLSSGIS